MSLNQSIILDNIIFSITTIVILIWVLRINISIKEKLAYLLLFIVFNSSYNIMVKPIHDYNTIILRNFIWRYKLIGPIGITDLIFIILFILLLKDIIKNMQNDRLMRLIYLREFIFIAIGFSSFLINKGYSIDSSRFFIEAKGIIYFFVTLLITIKYIKKDIDKVNYMKIFLLILCTSFLSTLIFDKYYLWIRYGNVIKIIDQEDAYTISLICIYYYMFKYFKNKKVKYAIITCVFAIQNLLCMYKLNIVYVITSIIILFVFVLRKTKSVYFLTTIIILASIFLSMINFEKIKEIATSTSIETRVYQSMEFMEEMNTRGIYATTFGLGMGTPYYSQANTDDYGEIKAVDKVYGNYKFVVQTPVIGVLKYVGILGFIVNIILTICILSQLYTKIRINKNCISAELISLISIFIFNLITGTTTFSTYGTIPIIMFNAFIIGRIHIGLKNTTQMKGN